MLDTSTYQVMLVEDDALQLNNLRQALAEPNITLQCYTSRHEAQQAFAQQLPDLLIADIILGEEVDGGFDLARCLQRYQRPIPIIFLSERQSEFDIMTGHDLGAIDYLPKPVSLSVLQRKVKNLLKLTQNAAAQAPSLIQHLQLDREKLKAYWHQQPLSLTVTEFEMIEQFAKQSPGETITYQDLQTATQGVVERNTINTHICRIRQAFKHITPDFDRIHNVYGRGYCWRSDD
ncbi:MAG: response regulator transcription factor [Thiomicrospira sp.]|nr:response regulator transcription factor [Thiomicrospira sp.]